MHLAMTLDRIGEAETNPNRRSSLLSQLDAVSEQLELIEAPSDRTELSEQIDQARLGLLDNTARPSGPPPRGNILKHQQGMTQFQNDTL
jgi:hypothetical protein